MTKFKLLSRKYLCVLLILAFICSTLTGCYDKREVDELGYCIAIGFDKGKTNFLKLTFQIAKPQAGGGESGGGDQEEPFSTVTIETPTLYSGLNMVNTFTSKQLNMSHTKVVVFSEELAKEGIESYAKAMLRGREFRPNMYMVIAKGSAEGYLRNIKPDLVLNPAKYYELVYQSYSYTGFIPNSQFHEFTKYCECLHKSPVAILGGVGKYDSSDGFSSDKSTFKGKERDTPFSGDFFAGDVTKTSSMKSENMGLAVFDGAKMVGQLDGDDVKYYLLTTGDYGHSYWTIPDMREKDKFVLLDIIKSREPGIKVDVKSGKPKIQLKINIEANILSVQSAVNYEESTVTKEFETYVEQYIKKGMLMYLEDITKEYKSDISGFGAYAQIRFATFKEWEEYNWKGKFHDSEYDVKVNFKIRRPGLLIKNIVYKSSQ